MHLFLIRLRFFIVTFYTQCYITYNQSDRGKMDENKQSELETLAGNLNSARQNLHAIKQRKIAMSDTQRKTDAIDLALAQRLVIECNRALKAALNE